MSPGSNTAGDSDQHNPKLDIADAVVGGISHFNGIDESSVVSPIRPPCLYRCVGASILSLLESPTKASAVKPLRPYRSRTARCELCGIRYLVGKSSHVYYPTLLQARLDSGQH